MTHKSAPPTPRSKVQTLFKSLAAESHTLNRALKGSVPDTFADWLATQYALAAHTYLAFAPEGPDRLAFLETITHKWVPLRRGDHSAQRLRLEQHWLNLERQLTTDAKEKEFERWLERPDIKKRFQGRGADGLSEETLRRIEHELRIL